MSLNTLRARWPIAIAVVVALIVGLLLPAVSRDTSHLVRGVLATVGAALLLLRWLITRDGDRAGPLMRVHVTLAFLGTIGWFNYFQFNYDVLSGINDYTDTSYYYTNSKYLEELGYDGLYAGALLCDTEAGGARTGHVVQIRDLRNDELVPREVGLAHGAEVKAAFTPERWTGFCHDIGYFMQRLSKRSLETNFFVDHGYNPPPTWSILGGNLAKAVDVENLKWICHADTVLVVGMFSIVGWIFGLETLLWVTLFYVTTFSGRWPILGMAILRFDWVVALVCGVAFLKRGWYGLAGGSLAFAAMNRVFPALFFFGWLVEALIDVYREKRLPKRHLTFASAALVVSLLMTGAATAQFGMARLTDSAHHLALHNDSFSSHRVGLGTVLVYRGEITRDQINRNGGMRQKELNVQSMKWGLRGAGIAALAMIAAFAWVRQRKGASSDFDSAMPAWELVPLVALPFFCATTPQVNYYNLRAVMVLWHGSKVALGEASPSDRVLHSIALALLFLTETAAQLGHWRGYDRHTVNAFSSIGLLVYFVVLWVGLWRKRA